LDNKKILAKDICFVIDTSGSMSGKKIQQAKEALRFCLNNLNPDDRFSIIPFSTEVRPYREALLPAKGEALDEAKKFVGGISAAGGTAINDALQAAFETVRKSAQDKNRPCMIVFMTDGLPTIGETSVDKIIENAKRNSPSNVRMFVFGVGNDVNTKLLDKLAEDNHGMREYVGEDENLELKLSNFYAMVANPVLSDLKLTFDPGLGVHDVYPKVLPDLFKGGELVVFGRYSNSGKGKIELAGQCGSESVKRSWDESFPQSELMQEYLPRLWATRKVGFLLDEIRLRGETKEVKEEVVRLAKRFGIVTPYTSYLIIEEDRGRIARGEGTVAPALSHMLTSGSDRASGGSGDGVFADGDFDGDAGFADFRAQSGAGAVEASKSIAGLREAAPGQVEEASKQQLAFKKAVQDALLDGSVDGGSRGGTASAGRGDLALRQEQLKRAYSRRSAYDVAASRPAGMAQGREEAVRYVGSRTFYRDGDKWVDSKYESKQEITKVELFSDDYFNLIKKYPEAAKYFALGKQVVVVLGGKAYETIEK
jgi:Ca-activated chloride channel homolog